MSQDNSNIISPSSDLNRGPVLVSSALMHLPRFCKFKDIQWSLYRPKRGGVIVYTNHNNKFQFALGLDRKSEELTDFGGGIRYSTDQVAYYGALRELKEESLGVFGDISQSVLQDAIVLCDLNMMIILIQLNVDPDSIVIDFNEKKKTISSDKLENSTIVWLSEKTFLDIARGITISMNIFNKVSDFIKLFKMPLIAHFTQASNTNLQEQKCSIKAQGAVLDVQS